MSQHETPSGVFVNFLAALVKAAPRALSQEKFLAWTDNGEELTRVLRSALIEGPQGSPKPVGPASLHAGICIPFELGGQTFDAVGFLKDEEYVLGEEAIRRVDNGHVIRSNEDWQFLYENHQDLPSELNDFWLATARPHPGSPRGVSTLYRLDVSGWYDGWSGLDDRWWARRGLVLRRRV